MKSIGIEIRQEAPELRIPAGMSAEEAISACVKDERVNANLISDGYHTFGELYAHRIELYIQLLKAKAQDMNYITGDYHLATGTVWKSKAHSDGSVWDGWFILGIFNEPGKQLTYHLPSNRWDDCDFAEELPRAPEWDGHTSADVLQRLKNL